MVIRVDGFRGREVAGAVLSLRKREHLRRQYRPERVRALFIGESPPASGRFFYRGDSGLYRAMREAFQVVDPSIDDASFLATFQSWGCYLVDLCPEPVDHLDSKARRVARRAAEASLVRTIARLQPAVIATIVRAIEDNVLRAVVHAKWSGEMAHLPYPGRWSHLKRSFVEALTPIIAGLRSSIVEPSVLHSPRGSVIKKR